MIKSQFLFAAALGLFLGCTQIPDDLPASPPEQQINPPDNPPDNPPGSDPVNPPDNPPDPNSSWSLYTDVSDNGASTAGNAKNEAGSYIVVTSDAAADGDAARIQDYRLARGSNPYDPYVGINLKNNGKPTGVSEDVSNCGSGYSYSYKGSAHVFNAQQVTVSDYNYHHKDVAASNAWKSVVVYFRDLTQSNWGPATVNVPFNQAHIEAFDWQVKGGVSATSGSLAVRNFKCFN